MPKVSWVTALPLTLVLLQQPANADWSDAVKAIAGLVSHALDFYKDAMKNADEKLKQDKKDALASVDANLIHILTLKKQMAISARCLGTNAGKSDEAAVHKSNLCYQNLNQQNTDLSRYVRDLKQSIDLVDPNWARDHKDAFQSIDDLYYEKLGMSNRTLQFARSSTHGIISKSVSVNAAECKQLADDLDAEAANLNEIEVRLSKALEAQ